MRVNIKCRGLSTLRRVLVATATIMAVLTFSASAQKTLLILDSYHQDELWGNSIVQPIQNYLASNDEIRCDVTYLNCATVPNDSVYQVICDNVFSSYIVPPDYVVMLGNFSFNLRDRIKKEWGDVPCLLISRAEGFGSLEDYFTQKADTNLTLNQRTPLSDVRDDYNFTTIFVPDYTHQTVDLMVAMRPEMDQLVFIADEAYVNKVCAFKLYNYILEEYSSKISFKWLKANEVNAEELRQYLTIKDPKVGLLLSSWTYEIKSAMGYPVLTVKDLNMVKSSANPVFSTRVAYMSLGCIGGVFSDYDEVLQQTYSVIDQMVEGRSMRDIPFYYPKEYYTKVDWPLLKKYGISESICPKGTIFVGRPETFIEKYGVLMCIVGFLLLLSLVLLIVRNSEQHKKISALKRHSSFVNNMPIPYTCAIVTVEMGGKIKSIKYTDRNVAFEKLIGDNYTSDGQLNVLPDEEMTNLADEMTAKLTPKSFTYHFERTDTYYDFTLYPIRVAESNGTRQLYIDVFVIDNTTSQKLQRGLEESAKLTDIAIEVTNLLPYKLKWENKELDFDITDTNVTNFDAEYHGKTLVLGEYMERIHPEDRAMFAETIEKLDKGEIDKFCLQYRMLDENEASIVRWFENRGVVSQAKADGSPVQIIGTLRNITETKERETRMAAALAKAEESDHMKSAFLANMSHEIRTPLNAIVGFSSLMVKETDEAVKKQLSEVINKNNDLLLTLINDVLDLAKIESNTIELMPAICDVNDLIDSICKTMSIRLPKGVKLNPVFYMSKCVIETDVNRLSQVLINLLTNACKFTKRGSITVGYELWTDSNMLYFFVRDTGIGIAPENQAKVFDQFVKLNNFAQGTGLGLAISKRLIEKMGGEIGVKSNGEGRGSLFWFTIPYLPVELTDMLPKEEESESIAEYTEGKKIEIPDVPEEMDKSGHLKPLMLVAEDNESNFFLIKHMLKTKYRMVNAQNGVEAVEMFRQLNPDIIIMDINMPEMDGYKAVEIIRKHSTTVPIIAVTAYAFASDRIRILNSGFDAYVPKPITEISIQNAINSVTHK